MLSKITLIGSSRARNLTHIWALEHKDVCLCLYEYHHQTSMIVQVACALNSSAHLSHIHIPPFLLHIHHFIERNITHTFAQARTLLVILDSFTWCPIQLTSNSLLFGLSSNSKIHLNLYTLEQLTY